MSNDKKSIIWRIIGMFTHQEKFRKIKLEKDPLAGDHLSTLAMCQWAEYKRPEEFLKVYLAQNAEHISGCEKCQNCIIFYKIQHRRERRR